VSASSAVVHGFVGVVPPPPDPLPPELPPLLPLLPLPPPQAATIADTKKARHSARVRAIQNYPDFDRRWHASNREQVYQGSANERSECPPSR
jgi:hypothetical protein